MWGALRPLGARLVLMAILAKTLLALVHCHLMTLVLLTVWHTFNKLIVVQYIVLR